MPRKPPAYDRRLIGTWKSDRRRTFEHFKPSAKASPKCIRKLKSLFGKLVVRWTRTRFHCDFEGNRTSTPYEVVASDDDSVVVRFRDTLFDRVLLRQIHFDGDYYRIAAPFGASVEWFRRVK